MEIDFEKLADSAEDVVRSRTFLVAIGLFVAAFAVRWMFAQHGFWIDEGRALLVAENFLHGNGFLHTPPDGYMAQHPFMFYTLIAISFVFLGINALAGMVTTNVLAALTVVAVYLTGRELFNEYAGVAAGILMMFDPLHFFYSTRVLTEVPVTFFVALTMYFWARTETRDESWSFYATFVAAGLALLTKLTAIVILPALFFYYLYKERETLFLQKKYWYGGFLTVGLFSLWELRNLYRFGSLKVVDVAAGSYFRTGGGGGAGGGSKFVEGLVSHTMELPKILGTPGLILAGLGLVYAYVYEDRRVIIPTFLAGVAFLFLSPKVITRYVLPFVPAAMVVAGYGVERTRQVAASRDERAGHVVFVLILVVSAGVMFLASSGMVQASAQGFTGLDDAGKWIRQNSAEDATVVAGSGNTIRFFSDRTTFHAGQISGEEEFYNLLVSEDVQYVEVDRWERTQPEWFLQTVQQSDAFQPVRGFGPQDQPSVVIYRVNQSMLGR